MRVGSEHTSKASGLMRVIEYRAAHDITVQFDLTGTIKTGVDAGNIRRGYVSDPYARTVHGVGYIGEGPYNMRSAPIAYRKWAAMIRRVTKPETAQMKKDYAGCVIAPEWLDFQSFAHWYQEQPFAGESRYELDKDLTERGNRSYQPDRCQIIPAELNNLISADQRQSRHGSGVCYVPSTGRFTSIITTRGTLEYLGTFDTAEEANAAYRVAHSLRIVRVARDLLNERQITHQQFHLATLFAESI